MTNIELIEEWYKNQCNGDWEHEYSIKIETLDNPGWNVEIDITDTFLEGFSYRYSCKEESNWIELTANGKIFKGMGSPLKLNQIFDKFINDFALPNIKNTHMIYNLYEEICLSSDIKIYIPINAKPVSLTVFEITSIPEYDYRDIKVAKIEEFEKITSEDMIKNISKYKIGDRVSCEIKTLYDGINLVIQ